MGRMIKRHRRQFAGIGLPLLFLLIAGAIGLSVAPGWINKAYTAPGDPCSIDNTNPLAPTGCDLCNREVCVTTSTSGSIDFGVCGNANLDTSPNATPTPYCPVNNDGTLLQPACWTACSVVPLLDGFAPSCGPSDDFCNALAGGDGPNACRVATCTPIETPDPVNNPTGCDYETAEDSNECRLCEVETAPPGYTPCGNGVCEPGQDEDCITCPEDCLVPGFDDVCPASETVLNNACSVPPGIEFISFNGPPFNQPNFDTCEDGQICTTNTCNTNTGVCEVVDISQDGCNSTTEDLCCPSNCNAPSNGSCDGIANCDLDCRPPEDCSPTPSPTPTVNSPCLQGSGNLGSSNNAVGDCGGCSSSLNPNGNKNAAAATLLAVFASLGVGLSLRKGKSSL